ncbi:hypothetical protein HDV57DRAFT_490629, partial [Trichoderma longibrachiatum]
MTLTAASTKYPGRRSDASVAALTLIVDDEQKTDVDSKADHQTSSQQKGDDASSDQDGGCNPNDADQNSETQVFCGLMKGDADEAGAEEVGKSEVKDGNFSKTLLRTKIMITTILPLVEKQIEPHRKKRARIGTGAIAKKKRRTLMPRANAVPRPQRDSVLTLTDWLDLKTPSSASKATSASRRTPGSMVRIQGVSYPSTTFSRGCRGRARRTLLATSADLLRYRLSLDRQR